MPKFETFTAARNHVEAQRLRPARAVRRRISQLIYGTRQPAAADLAGAEARARARLAEWEAEAAAEREALSEAERAQLDKDAQQQREQRLGARSRLRGFFGHCAPDMAA